MQETSICLIGKDGIFKEGVRSVLTKNNFYIAADYGSFADAAHDPEQRQSVQIVIVLYEETEEMSEKISRLRNIYADSRIVVISERKTMRSVSPALSANVGAFVLKDISCDGFIGALWLAADGKKIFPTGMLLQPAEPPDLTAVNSNQPLKKNGHGPRLSRQELNIVHCLVNGHPNKVIAQHLDITEATVKAHIKTILRKMGATNRTQAAIFAISRGILAVPNGDARLNGTRA